MDAKVKYEKNSWRCLIFKFISPGRFERGDTYRGDTYGFSLYPLPFQRGTSTGFLLSSRNHSTLFPPVVTRTPAGMGHKVP